MKRVLVMATGVLLVAGGLWIWRAATGSSGDAPSDATGEQPLADAGAASRLAGTPLGARLAIVTGAPGDAALAVVRIYNARARQPAPLGDATPVTVNLSADALATTLALELENGAAAPEPVPAVILRVPEPSSTVLGASPAAVVQLRVEGGDVPAAGRRIRAVLDLNGSRIETNWAAVDPVPTERAGQLAARAYMQEMIDPAGEAFAETAAALIAAAPGNPRGYWYTAISREARGDRAGALSAYRATADRLVPGDEPPVGLYMRIKRLER